MRRAKPEKPCTVLHDELVAGVRVALIDVTDGADNVLDILLDGVEVLLSVHRHPERDDGMKTYLGEETTVGPLVFDWVGLSRELGFVDERWLRFYDLRPTEALWSIVEPEEVWRAVLEVGEKKVVPLVRPRPRPSSRR